MANYTVAEKLQYAGITTGLGLLVVFAVLFAIIAIIIIYPKVLKAITGRKANKIPVETAAVTPAAAPVAQADDCELIAAITAAVCCFTGKSASDIVIRSYKRAGSSWKKAGRDAQILNRF